jgi:hypothetical protein
MVQVDVFWGYGFGASLAVAAGNQLSKTTEPFYTKYFIKTVLFLALFWAPTGMLLLLKHPSWETMQAADNFLSMSPWLVLLFGITNITQGILGFWVGQKLMTRKNYLAANLNWIAGYFGMFFILLYGWDGLGYDRFLYDRDMLPDSPAWSPGASGAVLHPFRSLWSHLQSSVAVTLYIDGVWLLPPFFYLMTKWIREAYGNSSDAPSAVGLIGQILLIIFVGGLGCAAISALIVNYTGALLGVGDHIMRASNQVPANTGMHVISYFIGLPLSLTAMWFLLWRPGMPFYRMLKPLMFEQPLRKSSVEPV